MSNTKDAKRAYKAHQYVTGPHRLSFISQRREGVDHNPARKGPRHQPKKRK